MRPAAAAFALLALLAQGGTAVSAQDMMLALPRPLHAGEIAWIEVKVGPIRRGQEIEVTTAASRQLGVISPFAVREAQDAGTYALPLPAELIDDGRLSIRVTITQLGGGPPRAPTAQEVLSVKLTVPGVSR